MLVVFDSLSCVILHSASCIQSQNVCTYRLFSVSDFLTTIWWIKIFLSLDAIYLYRHWNM